MKKGCLFLLVFWVGVGAFWYYRLQGTQFADQQPWISIFLGLSAALVAGNLAGITVALKQKRASSKSPGEWGDGDLICVSGQIRASNQPIVSPLSGKFCSIVEYEIKRRSSSEESSGIPEFRGMLMAQSVIQTMRGAVRVAGFPLFGPEKMRSVSTSGVYLRAAEYLCKTEFKDNPKNPLAMLKDLAAVLNDNDGDVKADFKKKSVNIDSLAAGGSLGPDSDDDLDDEDLDDDDLEDGDEASQEQAPIGSSQSVEPPAEAPSDSRVALVADGLKREGFSFNEVAVENGTDVTVFGTYRAQTQTVDISGGLSHLSHQFHFGKAPAVVGKQLRASVIGTVFWGVVFIASHGYMLNELGYDISGLLRSAGLPL